VGDEANVDPTRIHPGAKAPDNLRGPTYLLAAEEAQHSSAVQLRAGVAADLTGTRIGEQDAAGVIDHHHAICGALEEVRVALKELDAMLHARPVQAHLPLLVRERLAHLRIAQRHGRCVGDQFEQ
jgi:hypothetical protein